MAAAEGGVLDAIEHEVALFIRLSERVRLGAAEAAGSQLDRSGYLLLTRLERDGPMSVSDLAGALHLDVSTVTRQVAPLLQTGRIERMPARGRRGSVLRVSEPGRAELHAVRQARRALMAEITAAWTDAERRTFADLLSRFNETVQARRLSAPVGG
jgi:DNA-binding MarR family transcriptional regulator